MINARFRIQLPDGTWVGDLSREFPRATYRLVSGYKIDDDTALELGDVLREPPAAAVDAMREHPAIESLEELESADDRALVKYETTYTDLYQFAEQFGFTIEFPVDVERGWYEFDLTGTRDEFEALRDTFDSLPLSYELESLVSTADSDSLLTDRQRELLEVALREGYFEVPRECTLAELAAELGVDKSTASTVLRRGEATLLKWYLSGPDTRW